jgi:hypothetical protein
VRDNPIGRRGARAIGLVFVSVLLVLGLAACGASPQDKAKSATPSSSPSSTSTTLSVDAPTRVSFGSGSVGAPDTTTTVPTDIGGPTIPPGFAAGQNVIIKSSGFWPETLEANVSAPVVWTNLSGRPQRIIFVNFPIDSGTIPVGGTFTWSTRSALDMEYRSTTGFVGTLQMNQPNP